MVADVLQIGAASQGIIQMHSTAADNQEDVLHALAGDKLHYIIGQSQRFCSPDPNN